MNGVGVLVRALMNLVKDLNKLKLLVICLRTSVQFLALYIITIILTSPLLLHSFIFSY